jgi:hypothetical protein
MESYTLYYKVNRRMLRVPMYKRMDQAAFLGFDVWDFSLRSLARPYGWRFLASVLLRHPWRSLAGMRMYRRRIRPAQDVSGTPVGIVSRDSFLNELVEGDWMLGLGFCEKSLEPSCPAGRFNHRCWLLEQAQYEQFPRACRDCHVRELAMRALEAGAALHIMTSAGDVARDLLIPALRGIPWRTVMSICPFSIPPMSLALAISGCRGLIFGYKHGACSDYSAWDQADRGIKPEQTSLAPHIREGLHGLLHEVASLRMSRGRKPARHFTPAGNFYYPVP